MVRCYVGFGANLQSEIGSPDQTIKSSIGLILSRLSKRAHYFEVSPLFRTTPLGRKNQPDFYNLVMGFEVDMTASELLSLLHSVENELGRVRNQRWGARSLDLDLISYGDEVLPDLQVWKALVASDDPAATIENTPVVPHPRMHLRRFVLDPLLCIEPDWCHPVLKKSAEELREALLEDAEQNIEEIGPLAI